MPTEGSFALPGARRQFGTSRVVAIRHIDLWLRPDLVQQTLAAACTLTFTALDAPLTRVDLDAVDLLIDSVTDSAGPLEFVYRDATLAIRLRVPLEYNVDATVTVRYRVEQPRRGLFFVAPSGAFPDEPRQCWTHGHAGGAPHWFPCIDDPRQRQSSTMTIECKSGFFALANGELVERRDRSDAATTVFRYAQPQPHGTYLFTMVVGHFTELAPRPGALPVYAYVTPGRESQGERTFHNTPKMIEALERFTGAAYPYARYSQIAVARFPFIGMENTTAATLTDEWLLDERTLASPAVESLVVHELAHQWFGNFVSTSQWTDVWLNEGFASYCEAVWDGVEHGWEAYVYNVFCQVRTYVAEAQRKYQRPIICTTFRDPIDLFDKHVYEKASAVLHMLRGELGEGRFARAVARYVRENAGNAVETIDLIRAIERSTGRNMRAFFDLWVHRSGHPVVTITVEHDAVCGCVRLRFTQRQPIDDAHPAYRFSLTIGIIDELPEAMPAGNGPEPLAGERRLRLEVDAADNTFTIAVERAPALIRIDPGAWVLGEFEVALGLPFACAALAFDPDPVARIRAARALARDGGREARAAITGAMAGDPFWGARVEYATILGETRAPWARAVLLRALHDREATVRLAVCTALCNYRGADIADALQAILTDEPSVEVVGAALHALGNTRDPRAPADLVRALNVRSWCDVVGAGALLGLAEIGDLGALSAVLAELRTGLPERRQSALRALAVLAVNRPTERSLIVAAAIEALTDAIAMTRLRAIEALDALGDATAIVPLEQLALREPIPWIRSHSDRAAQRLRSAVPTEERLDAVNRELQTLRADHERLRDRIDDRER